MKVESFEASLRQLLSTLNCGEITNFLATLPGCIELIFFLIFLQIDAFNLIEFADSQKDHSWSGESIAIDIDGMNVSLDWVEDGHFGIIFFVFLVDLAEGEEGIVFAIEHRHNFLDGIYYTNREMNRNI